MIRLITLNCWKDEGDWAARMVAIGEALTRLQPDLVCLQEVYVGAGRDTGQRLAAATGLVCSHVAARPKMRGGIPSTSGIAILSRLPPLVTASFVLPTTPEDGGRKALVCTFATAQGPLRVASLHLSHLRPASAAALRAAQVSALIEHVAADWDGPLVLAGDFNALWSAPELAALQTAGWTSTAGMLAGQSSLIGRPLALIDHIVLRAPRSGPGAEGEALALSLAETSVVLDQPSAAGVMPSDHAGVMAVLI